MKRTLLLIAASCWLLFAVGFGALLLQYIVQGAGLQFFGWMFSSGSVLIGTVRVIRLVLASGICFAVGAVLCGHGIVRPDRENRNVEEQKK